jgi:hypothetical protein
MVNAPKMLHTRDLMSLTQFPHKACKRQTHEVKLKKKMKFCNEEVKLFGMSVI